MPKRKMIDTFFDKQPPRAFEKTLSDFDKQEIPCCGKFPVAENAVTPQEIFLKKGVFESEELLETVFLDFASFLRVNRLGGKKYPVELVYKKGLEKEEFIIAPKTDGCRIYAAGKEGVRRGLIRLEDLMKIGGGSLTLSKTHEKPVLKRRISRCFFSPTNRPPKNLVELDDDVDYYPDGYLNKLMHDGVNAVWIYSDFDSLIKTPFISEFGEGSERRIKKLNATIKKAKRYGIDVFLFLLEPISLSNQTINKRHPNISDRYPQTHGNVYHDRLSGEREVAFCTYTEFGKAYCIDAIKRLFSLVPELGGILSITQGERLTSCSTVYSDDEGGWRNVCPHCGKYSKAEILNQKIEVIKEGMRQAGTKAEYISWTYEHRMWNDELILEYVDGTPKDVVLMQNFEDNGREVQLGKKRVAIDYWLSYRGPSHMFTLTAEQARRLGKTMYAKMQVSCSHELASVPYVPVPGIIYDKLTSAKKLGVSGILESWYFGNYPCLMSKAAETLSFDRKFSSKMQFLNYLARQYRNAEEAPTLAKAWRYFERSYELYPLNVLFSYYGPMHDGIVWELSLLPKNRPLSRSWQLIDRTDGDRIGECLFAGHTAEEAETLLCQMERLWKKGCQLLRALPSAGFDEQKSVAESILLLIASSRNIVKFYRLRNELGYQRGDSRQILSKMKGIVKREIANSEKMIGLCKADSRLGFHSEAEGYKFFPAKLRRRIKLLKKLLAKEFSLVEQRIGAGLSPLAYYEGKDKITARVLAGREEWNEDWKTLSDGVSKFRLLVLRDEIKMECIGAKDTDFVVCNEFELNFPQPAVILKSDGRVLLYRDCITHQSLLDERGEEEKAKWQVECFSTAEKTRLIATLKKSSVGFVRLPYKLLVKTRMGGNWCEEGIPTHTLGKSILSPGEFGWVE